MLEKIYLYAVGVVLWLGLIMPFDAAAAEFQKAEMCFNGVNILDGSRCTIGTGDRLYPVPKTQHPIEGRNAFNLLRTSHILTTRIMDDGHVRFVIRNNRNLFNCAVAAQGHIANCYPYGKY